MFSVLILIIILFPLSALLIESLYREKSLTERKTAVYLSYWHYLLALAYYLYAVFNPSDSKQYFYKAFIGAKGPSWFNYYGVSTDFVDFLAFPFIHYLNFSYEAGMILFAWFGMIGFLLFYVVFLEAVKTRPTFFGYDLLTICLFVPNFHFWSSSIGKGSVVFLGFGLLFFGLSNPNKRFLLVLIGAIIIYHVRPHILFIILIAIAISYLFSSKQITSAMRLFIVFLALIGFYYIAQDVLALTGIDEEAIFEDSTTLSHRARELSKATSGVDINSYSFQMKLFTFWFRPLFFDAPGALGWIVSFENLFYLLLLLKVLRGSFISFLFKSEPLVKSALITFLGVSMALAQLSGNLGLAMRQKSQVMILILFVVIKFLDHRNKEEGEAAERRKKALAFQLPRINTRKNPSIVKQA